MDRENEQEWIIERTPKIGPADWVRLPGQTPRTLAACTIELAQLVGSRGAMQSRFRIRNVERSYLVKYSSGGLSVTASS